MKKIYKILLGIGLSISILISCLYMFFIYYIDKGGYGITPPTKYDKHIKEDISELPNQEIYEKDLKFIYEEIKNNYVNLDYKEKTFNFSWDDLYKTYDEKIKTINSEKGFYIIGSEFVSNLRDGHLTFAINRDAQTDVQNHTGVNAFDVRMIENKPIVVRAQKDLNIIGDEIVSINNIDFLNIVDTMTRYFYRGGNNISARNGILTFNYFYNYFYYFNNKYPDKLDIILKDKYGTMKTVSIKTNEAFSGESLDGDNDINFGFYNRNQPQPPSSKIINNVGYILIPTFDGNRKIIDEEFNKAVVDFKNNNVKGVVIDLRYNTGGNESFRDILGYLTTKKIYINNYRFRESQRYKDIYYFRTLYEDIRSKSDSENTEDGYTKWWSWEINPNKDQYLTTVPVVVLSNEGIFSSTTNFVNACLNFKLATVIGNMVPLSGNGLSTPIVLPSKKYILSYSFLEDRDIDFKYKENIVKEPDIKIEQTLDDYYKDVDSQLNNAFEFIKSKEKY